MTINLGWLAAPLILPLFSNSSRRHGVVAARLIIAAFGLAALYRGTGGLQVGHLQQFLQTGTSSRLFVSITIGVVLGGMVPRPMTDRLQWLTLLPLLVGLAAVLAVGTEWGLILGAVMGATPATLALALPPARIRRDNHQLHVAPSIVSLAVVVSIAAGMPLLVITMLSATVVIEAWLRNRNASGKLSLPVWPLVVVSLLALTGWRSIAIAGDVLVSLRGFLAAAPLSPAGERQLGFLLSATVVAMVAPWPFQRSNQVEIALPAAIALGWAASTWWAPVGVLDWMPLSTALLLVSVLAAGGTGAVTTMSSALAVLGALHGGTFGLVGASVLAVWTQAHRWSSSAGNRVPGEAILDGLGWKHVLLASGAAMVTVRVLDAEVVLGTLLAAGMAFILAWRCPRGEPSQASISIP